MESEMETVRVAKKYLKDNEHNNLHSHENLLGYLSLDNICSETRKVFASRNRQRPRYISEHTFALNEDYTCI